MGCLEYILNRLCIGSTTVKLSLAPTETHFHPLLNPSTLYTRNSHLYYIPLQNPLFVLSNSCSSQLESDNGFIKAKPTYPMDDDRRSNPLTPWGLGEDWMEYRYSVKGFLHTLIPSLPSQKGGIGCGLRPYPRWDKWI
jgi:hypothetical protein